MRKVGFECVKSSFFNFEFLFWAIKNHSSHHNICVIMTFLKKILNFFRWALLRIRFWFSFAEIFRLAQSLLLSAIDLLFDVSFKIFDLINIT